MRIWTYKNEDEKAHTLSRRSKNVKKRTKTYEKRILCKFTLRKIVECANKFFFVLLDISSHLYQINLKIAEYFHNHDQARSQKFEMGGGGCFGGLGAKPHREARGSGAGGTGVWGGAPNARKFCIFCNNNFVLGLF